ncbi:MAG TPA: ParB/RepB/Spo0J family partition protein [Terriglobia bacterium]|nr:ParB/RepB/Spo0J family partition protein [Terriglobia bacterium]
MTRKALGRGLSALIREPESEAASAAAPASDAAAQIPVGLIAPNPLQPRSHFREAELGELADSVRAKGVIQPVLVRRVGETYQLVAGERRWRAAKLAGLETVPAIVRQLDDNEALEVALTENLLRDDLGPLEAARAYRTLQERFGLSQEEIAARLGMNRVTVTNSLRLLRLPAQIQEMLERGDLTAGHARALLAVPHEGEQVRLAGIIAKRGLSVREAEKLAAAAAGPGGPAAAKPEAAKPVDPNVRSAVIELERALGTKVKITGDGKRGRVEISYFSAEDLDRIYRMLTRASP